MVPESEAVPLKPTRKPERPSPETDEPPRRELMFFNGWGGFTTDGREYVVVLEPGTVTPAPWVNVLANPQFGSVVSESGSGLYLVPERARVPADALVQRRGQRRQRRMLLSP